MKGEIYVYHYVNDKEFISHLKRYCGEIMQRLCHTLKEEYDIGSNFYLVGSGAKNLILQNESNPIDLDYNLEIVRCEDFRDCRYIKECVRKAFNIVLNQFDWKDCNDSKSSLTTKTRRFTKGNHTEFSIDVCITKRDEKGNFYRLIHEKKDFKYKDKYYWNIAIVRNSERMSSFTYKDKYYWNIAPNSSKIKRKVDFIKGKGKWEMVREQYRNIKNRYLTHNDYNHPSFVCYIEAVNNV